MRIDIYSDTVCPWCYLGKRRFDLAVAARPQYEPRISWRPFELNPELPVEGVQRAAFLAGRGLGEDKLAPAQEQLTQMGAAAGIAFRFDLIRRVPNTRWSHLLIALAGRKGRQGEIKERIMRAYFEEGRDIGDLDELVCLSVEAGLDASEARTSLVLRSGQDGVVAAERHASVLGITGVPTFIFNGQYSISGALEVGVMAGIFDQVAELAAAKGPA